MLKFFFGTELENLADRLFKELKENLPKDPLEKEIFVVPNNGMGQWLSLRMAEQEDGIAANLKFEFPSERIWSLIRLQDDDIPDALPSDRGPMTWTLMELFEEETFLSEFENLRHYIDEKDPVQRSMRSWKLASKIADVFDQYLIYRPQMILDWEKKKLHTQSVTAEKWQSQLWRRLITHWKDNYDGKYLHRAELEHNLWKSIDEKTLSADELPDRISVFGVSSASPAFIETMVKLSKLTEVHFYQLSVDPKIKESENFQNPLLQSLGTEGTKFMSIFSSYAKTNYQLVNNTEAEKTPSVFSAIQNDLRSDNPLKGRKLNVPPADQSIQVHNCHSQMREVEVLYDQLLALLDENTELSPDEILIMTPDIKSYVPVIEAVFSTPDEGQPGIPYAIADKSVGKEQPAIDAFLQILELCESRFKVTDVMDLMDSNPIREAFNFSDEELNRLEQWIADNRVRWGIDGKSKKDMNLPESDHYTWQRGLRRVLLGYMMHAAEDRLYESIYAYNEVETSEDAELAGKLSYFLNQLFNINKLANKSISPNEWKQELNEIADQFLPDNRDYFWEISKIRKAVNELAEQASLAGYKHNVPFAIVRRWMKENLQDSSTGGGRLGRGVTFSSLKPMRSIPFEVIGMIGMNEGTFPRSKIPIEFDLMHLDPEAGDPIQAVEDRYLFLENLLSARTCLYFSYVGQSNRQDSNFPPSVILQEFLDYLEEYYGLDPQSIVQDHHLQAFSSRYFTDENYFSYSQSQRDICRNLSKSVTKDFFGTELPEPEEEWKQLSISDLIAFFQHPARFVLRNRLGIYLREEDVLTDDREPFSLDSLDGYKIGQELLERFLKKESLESYEEVMQSRDMLPEGWSGEQAYRQKATEVRAFGHEIRQYLELQQLDDLEVDFSINDFRVIGTLSNVYEGAQMTYRFGKARPKDKIDWWIRHLLFHEVKPRNHSGHSLLLSWDKGSFEEYRLFPVENAEMVLGDLLSWYWKGLQKPLQLYCSSSYAFAESVVKDGKNIEAGIEKAQKKWEAIDTPSYYQAGEGDDSYNQLVTSRHNPFDDEFTETARQIWTPFFKALNKEKP